MSKKQDFDINVACAHFGQIFGQDLTQHDLWTRALCHRSLDANASKNNERLEFLGDRVMGMAVAELLYQSFSSETEGDLSRRHARLVSRETLIIVGYQWEIPRFLQFSQNTPDNKLNKKSLSRGDETMMADAVEALLGALFLEHGFSAVQSVIIKTWQPLINAQSEPPVDPKSELQEWTQAKGLGLPTYIATGQTGPDHAPKFTIEVSIDGFDAVSATGSNKRTAERNAAAKALETWQDKR